MDKTIFMELLHAREFKAVRSILNVMNAVDIAALMTELEDKELAPGISPDTQIESR